MGCPLKDLDTSALSASPRRLTEGVLEVEGPISADAGVASCLLFNAEPVFRRLRDDLFDGKILVGMIQRGGNELQKGSVGNLWKMRSFRGADSQLELYGRKRRKKLEQGIKRGKNYVVLTMRLAMIFSFTRLLFGEGLECDHLYANFIHGLLFISSIHG